MSSAAPAPAIAAVRQPQRSQTMPVPADDRSAVGRHPPPAPQWVPQPGGTGYDFPQPRAPGLYSQPNHSSPALAFHHSAIPSGPELDPPTMPAVDDINLGLENMHFEQRGPNGSGQDGAIEIRGKEGHTASIYSVDSSFSQTSAGPSSSAQYTQGPMPSHVRQSSSSSARTYGANGADAVDGYLEERPHSGGSYLPYDYPPQQSQQPDPPYNDFQPSSHAPPQPYSDPNSAPYGAPQYGHHPPPPQHLPHSFGPPPSNYVQPPFPTQPQHGGWGFDYSAAAAQNPYYAAATGQLGFPDGSSGYGPPPPGPQGPYGLARQNTSVSSMSSMGYGATTPAGSLGRSTSSVNLPNNGGPPGNARRKPSGNGAGPPITKASVDEYRNRIKADPDPEAQFNFAKYLIEAARKISSSASGDEKAAKKYRDALLAESVKLIKRLATTGVGIGKPAYADAQFFLANCLGNGSLGLQVDHEKAYNLYVQASKQNHASATYRTAVCNEVGAGTRRDHARAVLFYRKASALGDTAGMYKLGMILLNGLLGQQKNTKDAITWLKRAAVQADEDNPHALHELGLLYEKAPPAGPPGSIPPLLTYDPTYARELFTTAGQYGYPPSQFKLGSCYEYGTLTCPVDPRRSIAWYTRAAERGDAESELALSGWYLTGSEGILKQSDSEAYLWARRAANKGLPKAEYAVGYYSEVGIGVKQDLEEAKRWYMRAAAQGNKRAMTRLSELREIMKKDGAKGGKVSKGESRKR